VKRAVELERLIREGHYEEARAAIESSAIAGADPSLLLVLFSLRVRLLDFEGARAALARILELDPGASEVVSELRLCAEAEAIAEARLGDAALAGKRVAIRPPPPFCLPFVKAAVMRAGGDHAEAARAIEEGRAEAPALSGEIVWTSGRRERFVDITDADDVTGPILPAYEGGSVIDVPYGDLLSIELAPPQSYIDVLWGQARLTLRDGDELIARVPMLYARSGRHVEPHVRTGQMTVWDRSRGYAEAAGHRDLKVSLAGGGLAMVGLGQVERIAFDPAENPEDDRTLFAKRMFG
jgi:protein involved in temperature-dependent protein secretion